MEKRLTREELLESLIKQARDPFCTPEKYDDIRKIIFFSDTFSGMNHLFVAKLFIEGDSSLFSVDEEEALRQIALALKEGNKNAYHAYYQIYKKLDEHTKARNYLRVAYDLNHPLALLDMGKEHMDGGLFQKDLSFAYACFGKAIKAGRKEGYYYQVLIDTLRGNIEKAKEDTRRAAVDNYPLPGVVE